MESLDGAVCASSVTHGGQGGPQGLQLGAGLSHVGPLGRSWDGQWSCGICEGLGLWVSVLWEKQIGDKLEGKAPQESLGTNICVPPLCKREKRAGGRKV